MGLPDSITLSPALRIEVLESLSKLDKILCPSYFLANTFVFAPNPLPLSTWAFETQKQRDWQVKSAFVLPHSLPLKQ